METVKLGLDMMWQLNLLLYSLILGIFLGAFFDVMRISRVFLSLRGEGKAARIVSDTVLVVVSFIEDIAFFTISAATLILFCFQANGGTARSFILLGALGGFLLYIFTVGRLTKLISAALSRLIYRLLDFIRRRVIFPIAVFISRLFKWIYAKTLGYAVSFIGARLRYIYTEKSSRELIFFASRQFIKTKGLRNETGTDVHTDKARNISRVPVYDNHARKRSDRV